MDDYEDLSDEAKQAWWRGFDLAYPRHDPTTCLTEKLQSQAAADHRLSSMAHAVDVVASALERLGNGTEDSAEAANSDTNVRMVVMDPLSVEAVIVEFDKLDSEECKDALGRGFLRGMIAKAKAAQSPSSDDDTKRLN